MPVAIIKQVELEANSALGARYLLRLLELREGYAVERVASARGRKPQVEAWFRWDRQSADKLFARIARSKTKQDRQRRYYPVCFLPDQQLSLFAEG